MKKGLLVAACQLAIVLGMGGKLLIDRARFPREWVRARPYDPEMPVRGRYVRLWLELPGREAAPAVFFIPEHATGPSERAAGEELWAEVTLVPNAPPRPIRLGIRKDGVIKPI